MIKRSQEHIALAKYEKENIIEKIDLLPDFSDKEYLKAIVISAFTSAVATGAKAKVLSIGLPLLGTMLCDFIEDCVDLRYRMTVLAGHLEMAAFYNHASLLCRDFDLEKEDPANDDWSAYNYYISAVNSLTLCDMYALCIYNIDSKFRISKYITDFRNELLEQMNNGIRSYTKSFIEKAEIYYKNLNAILEKEDANMFIFEQIKEEFQNAMDDIKWSKKILGVTE